MTSHSLTEHASPALSQPGQWPQKLATCLFASHSSTGTALQAATARIALAGIMLPHGLQKSFGLFGGYGWSGTMNAFTEHMGMPVPIAAAVILTETVGPLLLLAGLLVRPVAAAFIGLMVGAIAMAHWPHGFFMNWYGQQAGEGFEYHLLFMALAAVLLIAGGGRWSADSRIGRLLTP